MEKLILWGRNSVNDAINAKLPIMVIYVNNENLAQKIKTETTVKVVVEDNKFFDQITRENHQGIIAVLKDFPIYDLAIIEKEKPNNVLVLDKIQDPHNLGAILRTANALGIKHIILSKDRSAGITSTVLKVSSGGFVGVKVVKVNNLVAALKRLKKAGYWVYSSALSKNAQHFDKVDYNKPTILVIGNEGSGVSQPVLNESDVIIYIPQKGTVQSLNVSVAAGLLINQITKE
ncbi:23S rRNA (guanosine(2251)-2'-O)-methyltransferase RlmB [Mycoplasma sp. ES3157-GEN-MYC]|uniref:23S rRNA (Guanosine(2251)-2'-O)-methyltransferase RlmB n=1 Tax=Mycoplasma miroungigenitalium TaxID=754515 RepID=A0A6M4JAV4_9MOLU|nr:23S rRNA (guanosine(2251)-2'-O)-methyltransferase RlmB [Mycoplasma miroungigenitalium]MBU4690430.1 23S rRNA (guanosine(2251)-2'-O)-methyltransferase RlmB [Mycoplasma miroungigenitalium]MBU4691697.1 23S rRNA (guanosine(2251)-2'-O)-methyltransferase RlmB [Mycoplasma miroungigenitalium]QJR43525.1 23S rRNA (guanosine(2251)-2'-O)-methyltransferase RlmB [Mycoplasma miroungigenitalium]